METWLFRNVIFRECFQGKAVRKTDRTDRKLRKDMVSAEE
jgi:hypothetical protein